MTSWREVHKPHLHWAPSGLPRRLGALPGWVARLAAESRVGVESAGMLIRSAQARSLLPGDAGSDRPDSPAHADKSHSRAVAPEPAPVLVVPGFGFGDASTGPLRGHLSDRGFTVLCSGMTFNIDCGEFAVDAVEKVAQRAVEATGRRVDVVGQSRGGMIARGLLMRRPDLVRRVVTLGAPLADEFAFYELPAPLVLALRVKHQRDPKVAGRACVTADCTCPYTRNVTKPLPAEAELVSLYSKSDGVVDWRSCLMPGAVGVEIGGSHLGMGFRGATLDCVVSALRGEFEGQRDFGD